MRMYEKPSRLTLVTLHLAL